MEAIERSPPTAAWSPPLGPPLAEILERCLAETGLPAPARPVAQ